MLKVLMLIVFVVAALAACQSAPAATPSPSSTPSLEATPIPTATTPAYSQQYEIREQDSGKTFVYSITSRFSVILSQDKYPKENLKVGCDHEDVIGSISNIPSVQPPLYAVRYEGVTPGTCTITDGSFHVTVEIVQGQ